jgi:hypothetical protein
VSEPAAQGSQVSRIDVRVQVGDSLLAASDDPLFLGLRGSAGREFRLLLAHGKSLRRKAHDHYVLVPTTHPDSNVKFPELNDPTDPPLDADTITGVYLRKGLDPIPNVRAVGELDDRLEVVLATVEIHTGSGKRRYHRAGPLWLGLNAGLVIDLARLDGA